ncbi:uncharacterized protein LOC129588622 [Paramacrobiotus metropolitanus]|uniref:uncharacterized protein LOC129588622 n=1 Tax=Paramacrobiotus metropolitanus TaxID=2943436 RepID=UPI0024459C65|nr:uncharacterized protein LOC129588622 [Paramacrobiotus metropolitanus]
MVVVTRNSLLAALPNDHFQTTKKPRTESPNPYGLKQNGTTSADEECSSVSSIPRANLEEILDRRIGPLSGKLEYYTKAILNKRTSRVWIEWTPMGQTFTVEEMQKVVEFDQKYEQEVVNLLQDDHTATRIKTNFVTRLIFDPRPNITCGTGMESSKQRFLLEVYLSNSLSMDRTVLLPNAFMRQHLRKALCEFYEDAMVARDTAVVILPSGHATEQENRCPSPEV